MLLVMIYFKYKDCLMDFCMNLKKRIFINNYIKYCIYILKFYKKLVS